MAPTHPRAVLAANLNRMIDADVRPGERRSVRAWALSKRLDVRLIDRLTKQQHAVTLDTLQIVADALGLQPWQLLIPDLDPTAPPPMAPMTEAERRMIARLRDLLDR